VIGMRVMLRMSVGDAIVLSCDVLFSAALKLFETCVGVLTTRRRCNARTFLMKIFD
jgi:hypothetical protein